MFFAALDLAYAVVYRSDSMADDGNMGDQSIVRRMLCDVFGVRDVSEKDIRSFVCKMILQSLDNL